MLSALFVVTLPLQSTQSVAFATHTNQMPTPTPWGYGGQPGIATPTPTLYGYGTYQPAQGQPQYPGSSVQPNPVSTDPYAAGSAGQQSVSSPS